MFNCGLMDCTLDGCCKNKVGGGGCTPTKLMKMGSEVVAFSMFVVDDFL